MLQFNGIMEESQQWLLNDEKVREEPVQPVISTRSKAHYVAVYASTTFALLVLATIAGLFTGSSINHIYTSRCPQRTEYLCSATRSSAEARSLGCKVDPMDLGWVHPKCWDQQFLDEWAHPDKFQFSLDEAFQNPVSPAQISSAEVELPFVTKWMLC